MKALLISTGYEKDLFPLIEELPTPLFQIVNKPIIIHIIETLKKSGITNLEIILQHLPEIIETTLEDGKKWGVNINYHLAKDDSHIWSILYNFVRKLQDDRFLIGKGDYLPNIDIPSILKEPFEQTVLFFDKKKDAWSGWGYFSKDAFLNNVPKIGYLSEAIKHLECSSIKRKVSCSLSTRNFSELRKSNLILIRKKTPDFLFPSSAKTFGEKIWIGRGSTIHPSVIIRPPVFIGESCNLKKGVRIGPNTVIENHCIIDTGSILESSLICQNSYVGEHLDIKHSIVSQDLLVNLFLDTKLHIPDQFILSPLHSTTLKVKWYHLLERALALVLLLLFSPFIIGLFLSQNIYSYPVVYLPLRMCHKKAETFTWYSLQDEFLFRFPRFGEILSYLISLIPIVFGKSHFMGVKPRTLQELDKLPENWKPLYLKSKVGMFTLASPLKRSKISFDEELLTELYYTAHMGFFSDLKFLFKILSAIVKRFFSKESSFLN